MKYSELERKLKRAGCRCVSKDGSHPIWYSPITGKEFTTGHHKGQEVKKGTLKSIMNDSGVRL